MKPGITLNSVVLGFCLSYTAKFTGGEEFFATSP